MESKEGDPVPSSTSATGRGLPMPNDETLEQKTASLDGKKSRAEIWETQTLGLMPHPEMLADTVDTDVTGLQINQIV